MDTSHGQLERAIPAGEFKQKCLALLDEVSLTGLPLVITKRGRPIARVSPLETRAAPLAGSLQVLADDDEALFSTGERWEADGEE